MEANDLLWQGWRRCFVFVPLWAAPSSVSSASQVPRVRTRLWRRALRLPGKERPVNAQRSQEVLQTDHVCPGLLPQSFHMVSKCLDGCHWNPLNSDEMHNKRTLHLKKSKRYQRSCAVTKVNCIVILLNSFAAVMCDLKQFHNLNSNQLFIALEAVFMSVTGEFDIHCSEHWGFSPLQSTTQSGWTWWTHAKYRYQLQLHRNKLDVSCLWIQQGYFIF